jgi:hypothetical protein
MSVAQELPNSEMALKDQTVHPQDFNPFDHLHGENYSEMEEPQQQDFDPFDPLHGDGKKKKGEKEEDSLPSSTYGDKHGWIRIGMMM